RHSISDHVALQLTEGFDLRRCNGDRLASAALLDHGPQRFKSSTERANGTGFSATGGKSEGDPTAFSARQPADHGEREGHKGAPMITGEDVVVRFEDAPQLAEHRCTKFAPHVDRSTLNCERMRHCGGSFCWNDGMISQSSSSKLLLS